MEWPGGPLWSPAVPLKDVGMPLVGTGPQAHQNNFE